MDSLPIKLLFAVVILLAGWIGGWIPVALGSGPSGRRCMGWGNALAAGIFLGTGFIHLIGEAGEEWLALGSSYTVALSLATVGFMSLLLVEHVLLPQSVHGVVHAHAGEPLGQAVVGRLASGPVPYALLLALSVHSIIAGLALGAQEGTAAAFFVFVAIIAHKSAAAFALGISLVKSDASRARLRRLLAAFALSTPAGIVAGTVLGSVVRSSGARYFDASVTALAAGTFIYIGAVDILHDEFLRPGGRLAKWLAAALGAAFTAVLSRWF